VASQYFFDDTAPLLAAMQGGDYRLIPTCSKLL
jgi:hypothetical protein